MSRVITVKGLNVVSGCQGHHCQEPGCQSLSRAWMSESSLSRAWTLSLDVRVITAKVVTGCQSCSLVIKGLYPRVINVKDPGCQSHHSQGPERCLPGWKGSSLSRCLNVVSLDVKGHHCQGPERGVWMSGSSLPRAWTLCLDVSQWLCLKLFFYTKIIFCGLTQLCLDCQGHHCRGPERCHLDV